MIGVVDHIDAIQPVELDRLDRLFRWPLSSTRKRFAKRHSVSEDFASRTEENYRRYLSLFLLEPNISQELTGPVDDFWHEHIIDTRDYASLCEQVFGYFAHHVPVGDPVSVRGRLSSYAQTLKYIEKHYGELDRDVWPPAASGRCGGGKCYDIRPRLTSSPLGPSAKAAPFRLSPQ